MTKKEKERLISYIKKLSKKVDIFCEDSIIEFVCSLFEENKRKKVLIRNDFGLLGNMLDKYKYEFDVDIVKEIIIYDSEHGYGCFGKYFVDSLEQNLKNSPLIKVLKKNGIEICVLELCELLINDKRVLKSVKDVICFDYVEKIDCSLLKKYFSNKKVLLNALKDYCGYLEFAPDELKNDREVVIEAIKNDGIAITFASEYLQNDKELVLMAVRGNAFSLEYVSEDFKNNKEIVLEAVKYFGGSLEFASEELKNDSEVVLEAVRDDGMALEYASEELKNDKEIVMAAVKHNGNALRFASKELKKDEELIALSKQKNNE